MTADIKPERAKRSKSPVKPKVRPKRRRTGGKPGRPPLVVVPQDIAQQILAYLRRGNSVAAAAEGSGIHRDTFYEWVKRGEDGEPAYAQFALDVRKARAQAELLVFEIVRAEMAGEPQPPLRRKVDGEEVVVERSVIDPKVAMWWLSHHNRAHWGATVAVTGANGGPVATVDVTKLVASMPDMTDEDLQKVIDGTHPALSGAATAPKAP